MSIHHISYIIYHIYIYIFIYDMMFTIYYNSHYDNLHPSPSGPPGRSSRRPAAECLREAGGAALDQPCLGRDTVKALHPKHHV